MASITGDKLRTPSIYSERVPRDEKGLPAAGIYFDEPTGNWIAVRSPKTRPLPLRNVPEVLKADLAELVDLEAEPQVVEDEYTGVEGEANAVDSTEWKPVSIYDENNNPAFEMACELFDGMLETDVGHRGRIEELYSRDLPQELGRIACILGKRGALIDPASARMQDIPTEENLAPSDYIRSNYAVFGPKLLKFIAAGVHEHHDLDFGYSPVVDRYLRVVMPLLTVGLQAAPHAYGKLRPDLFEHLSEHAPENGKDLKEYANRQPLSVRYPVRWATSTDGGVGRRVVHDTVEEWKEDVSTQLVVGPINHAARGTGSHANTRARPDLPFKGSRNRGRIEICAKDTSAYRFETLAAYGELSSAVVRSLEKVAEGGKKNIAKLHNEFPTLFGNKYSKHVYAEEQLERAHKNFMEISYEGSESQLIDGIGNEVSVKAHMTELFRFLEYSGCELSEGARKEIAKSIKPHKEVIQTMHNPKYLDENGAPSLSGYYDSGEGSAGLWMDQRAKALGATDRYSNVDIMRLGTQDRATSFRRYLGRKVLSQLVTQ